MNKSCFSLLVILMTSAGVSAAEVVQLTGYTHGPASTVAVTGYTGGAGEYAGTFGTDINPINNPSFQTYCTDLFQTFFFGSVYTDYSVVGGATAWGGVKAEDLGKLFTANASYVVDADTSAAMQVAIWEIIYETEATYSFGSGVFQVNPGGVNPVSITALTTAQGWLTMLPGVSSTMKIDQLFSLAHQDFLTISMVPEPSTPLLALIGLGIVGLVATRRA